MPRAHSPARIFFPTWMWACAKTKEGLASFNPVPKLHMTLYVIIICEMVGIFYSELEKKRMALWIQTNGGGKGWGGPYSRSSPLQFKGGCNVETATSYGIRLQYLTVSFYLWAKKVFQMQINLPYFWQISWGASHSLLSSGHRGELTRQFTSINRSILVAQIGYTSCNPTQSIHCTSSIRNKYECKNVTFLEQRK